MATSTIYPPVPPELKSQVDVLWKQYPQYDQFMRAYQNLYARWTSQGRQTGQHSPVPGSPATPNLQRRPGQMQVQQQPQQQQQQYRPTPTYRYGAGGPSTPTPHPGMYQQQQQQYQYQQQQQQQQYPYQPQQNQYYPQQQAQHQYQPNNINNSNTSMPMPPSYRSLPTPHPLTKSSDPAPPFTPLSKTGHQALLTTYPSRLKLGLTSLMQPLNPSNVGSGSDRNLGGGSGSGAGGDSRSYRDSGAGSSSSVLGKRQRQVVNYAEIETFEDLESSSDNDDGDNDNDVGPSGRPIRSAQRKSQSGYSTPDRRGSSTTTQQQQQQQQQQQSGALTSANSNRTYLGELPPGNLIIVEPAKRTKHVYPNEVELNKFAESKTLLVPIRIELDTDTHRIRDCFVWNLQEQFVTPELFAQLFCDDVGISQAYQDQISASIRNQIDELTGVAEVPLLTDEQIADSVETDLRVVINLDVQIQTLHLVDRLEWDLSSQLTPELFARQMASELGLCSEAVPLISHCIHEELLRAKKDCLEQGLIGVESTFFGGRERGAKQLEGIWRDLHEVDEWGPRVIELTPEEIEQVEVERERHSRRIRRDQMPRSGRRFR